MKVSRKRFAGHFLYACVQVRTLGVAISEICMHSFISNNSDR